jgi:uncharacterized delta-60 repeat protein
MKASSSVNAVLRAGCLLLQLSALTFRSPAAPGDVDLSFDPGSGVNGKVSAVAVQPDGKLVIGGRFTTVRGLARTNLARLNADGSGDASFNAGTASTGWFNLFALALQSDGKVLVGHDNGITRFHSDGSPDTNFVAALNPWCIEEDCYFNVQSITAQLDGKIIVAGAFSTGTGTNTVYGLARLNANGSLDARFNPISANFWVAPITLQPDDKLLVGGYFLTNVCNAHGCYDDYRYSLTRLNPNGSRDETFNAGAGLPWIQQITLQSDGKLLVAGGFTNGNLARLNADGSLDGAFNPVTAHGIESVAVQSDGHVLIGGGFDIVNGSVRRGIARLNASGSLDGGFDPGAGFTVLNYPIVQAVVVQTDGRILIGGNFTSVNPTNHSYLDRLNLDGSLDSGFNPGRQLNPFSALAVQSDGKVLIGGPLTFSNGTNRYGRDRLNSDGSLDAVFVSSTNFHPDLAFVIQAGDCRGGPDFECSQSLVVSTVLVQADGRVFVGGYSATVDVDLTDNHPFNSYRSFLARLNADGSRDTNFAPVIGGLADVPLGVSALAVQTDGKVLFGGPQVWFTRCNADGSVDNSFNPNITGRNWVASIALQADGQVLIGGNFSTLHGTNVSYGVARLHADGTLDSSFNPGTGTSLILSVALQPDGKVLIGGNFTTFSGTPRNRIARLNSNGSVDGSFNPGTGASESVRTVALQSDGKVLIGGDFTAINGVVRPHIARLYGDSAAPSLSISLANGLVTVSWPVTGLSFQLQESTNFALPDSWSPVAQPAVTNLNHTSVTVPATIGRQFFRLNSQ